MTLKTDPKRYLNFLMNKERLKQKKKEMGIKR